MKRRLGVTLAHTHRRLETIAKALIVAGAAVLIRGALAADTERFNGLYAGRMCMLHVDNSERCIDVALFVRHGMLSANWPSPWNTNLARAYGTITSDGIVDLALSGFSAKTNQPMPGKVHGTWEDGTIKVVGA